MLLSIPTTLLASIAAALPCTSTSSPQPPSSNSTILKALAGTYSLLNTSSTLNNVQIPDATYGSAPVGMLMYTASGYMSATITATEAALRPLVRFPFGANDTDADWALVGKHSIGYAGPFRLNPEVPASETQGQVFHGPLTVANVPTMAGEEQKRNYTLVDMVEQGSVVTYLRIGSERGGGYRGVLWWRKLD